MHEGKRIQIAHLVRHVARHDADALIAIDNPSIDQMPGTVLQCVSIEQTIHDLGGTNDARTRSQYLQQRRDERVLALGGSLWYLQYHCRLSCAAEWHRHARESAVSAANWN